jgi:hypothetical protein
MEWNDSVSNVACLDFDNAFTKSSRKQHTIHLPYGTHITEISLPNICNISTRSRGY